MILSLQKEYPGNCQEVIAQYKNTFPAATVEIKTFNEMPEASMYGIVGDSLDLIWKSAIIIPHGENSICLEMSDSLLVAMQNFSGQLEFEFIEQIQVQGEQATPIENCGGIEWLYQKSETNGIFYFFEFDGFCKDVILYYENAFNTKAYNITYHGGTDKIKEALISFGRYSIKLCDTVESAQNNANSYDPNALLFYKSHNPILSLKCADAKYLAEAFAKLSIGAKLNKPITPTDNGVHGSLIDKYGICWEVFS